MESISKTVFLYDPVTLEFSGSFIAQENPVRAGEFLTPLYFTENPPGILEPGSTHLYNIKSDSWNLIVDPIQIPEEPDLSKDIGQAFIDTIAKSALELVINYIADKEDAPRELKAARAQINDTKKAIDNGTADFQMAAQRLG